MVTTERKTTPGLTTRTIRSLSMIFSSFNFNPAFGARSRW